MELLKIICLIKVVQVFLGLQVHNEKKNWLKVAVKDFSFPAKYYFYAEEYI